MGAKSRDSCIPVQHDRVPPYHPDYYKGEAYPAEGDDDEDSLVSSDDEVEDDEDIPLGGAHDRKSSVRVRRGSEGYEVRPVSREQMLRQYLESVGEDYDRYIRYIPQPESESGEEVIDDAAAEAVSAK